MVATAGNSNTARPAYPAAYPNVIAVAATDKYDRRASFSNRGNWVDVAAPGVDVLSTVPSGYDHYSGISMAAPHVSALAGLLASQGRGPKATRYRMHRLGPRPRRP